VQRLSLCTSLTEAVIIKLAFAILLCRIFTHKDSQAMSRPTVSGIKMNWAAATGVHFSNIPTTIPHHIVPLSETRLRSKKTDTGKEGAMKYFSGFQKNYEVLIFATSCKPNSSMAVSRISTFRILPVTVIGKPSVNFQYFGIL
jgi:hypothetical protein